MTAMTGRGQLATLAPAASAIVANVCGGGRGPQSETSGGDAACPSLCPFSPGPFSPGPSRVWFGMSCFLIEFFNFLVFSKILFYFVKKNPCYYSNQKSLNYIFLLVVQLNFSFAML